MNAIEEYYKSLDEKAWDARQEGDINNAIKEAAQKLSESKQTDLLKFLDIEHQTFNFNKTPEKRSSFKMSGTQKLEDGSEVPFEWPDISTFRKEDFDYLYRRFNESKNSYAKVEYGLVLFYSKNKQDNAFVEELLKALFKLLESYIEKALKDEKGHHILNANQTLANALHIASKRKDVPSINSIYEDFIKFTFDLQQKWDIERKTGLRTVIDFTDFAIQYFKDFIALVDVKKILDKNWEAANYLSKSYVWGAIYVADVSTRLCKKLNIDPKEWQRFRAAQFEKLAEDAESRNDISAVSFVESAMEIYKGIKEEPDLKRIELKYQNLRASFKLGEVRKEMPQDEIQRILELIKTQVREGSEEDIVKTLLFTPMIRPLQILKEWSEESLKQSMLLNLLPTTIQDKFGNTVAQFVTEEERKRFSLLRTYEFHLQTAVQTILQYFIEAFRSDKLSANSVIKLLELTWMGEDETRIVGGTQVSFSYVRLVESGIKSFFYELNQWKSDPSYSPNFVASTDSLVLKTEYLLRQFCYFLGIPTFKQNPKDHNIVMEKTLDDLLRDLEGKLSEDDHFFIKFILTEKAGYNLRNRIAHGLMDDVDYGPEYPLLAMILILKLSNYQFSPVGVKDSQT